MSLVYGEKLACRTFVLSKKREDGGVKAVLSRGVAWVKKRPA